MAHGGFSTRGAWAAAASVFLPTSATGCVLWLRGDMGVTLNGSTVSNWNDQSGTGNHFVQATSAVQPLYVASGINSLPSLDFAAADASVACTNSITMRTVFLVASYPSASFGNFATSVSAGTSSGDYVFRGDNGTTNWRTSDGTSGDRYRDGTLSNSAGTLSSTKHVYMWVGTSTKTSSAWRVGDDTSTGGREWDGQIAEVIGYSGLLSGAEEAAVELYLAARYGITFS
jgi:hypothetical protein